MSEAKERRSFTDEQKREIVEYASRHSTNEAAKKFKMKPPQISAWKKKLSLGVTSKPSTNTPMVGQVGVSPKEYVAIALELSERSNSPKKFLELSLKAAEVLLQK
jgi:transposase-like protein